MYVRPLLRLTFYFAKKTRADKFLISYMQSKLDVLSIHPRLQLITCPGFRVKGGSDVQFFCTSDPPVRPTPFGLEFMKLFCIFQMCFAESKYHNIFYSCHHFKIRQICQGTPTLTMIFWGLLHLLGNQGTNMYPSLIFCTMILKHAKKLFGKFVTLFL